MTVFKARMLGLRGPGVTQEIVDDTVRDETIARQTRIAWTEGPAIADDGVLLVPGVSYFSPRLSAFSPVNPPSSGLTAAKYWPIPLVSAPGVEARVYFDLAEAQAGRTPFRITADVPFSSSETQIIVATVIDGVVTAMPGAPIVGPMSDGVATNQVTFGYDMDAAPRMTGTTTISTISDSVLVGFGYLRGARNTGNLKPYVGADIARRRYGDRYFARTYVQGDSDFGFGTPTIKFYSSDGSVIASQALDLERVLSTRAAAFSFNGVLPDGAASWQIGIEDPFGHDIRLTGLQFANGPGIQWIARSDYPVLSVATPAAPKLQAVSTRLKTLREFIGPAIYTRTEGRMKAKSGKSPTYGCRLIFGNFYTGPGTGEFDGANPITVYGAIEPTYATPYVVPATFNGARSARLDPGAIVLSDILPGVTLTDEEFWVRAGCTVAAPGMTWPQGYYAFQEGEAFYDSTAASSQVFATGAMSLPSGGALATSGGFGPIGMVGYTHDGQLAVAYPGDSIADGAGDLTLTIVDGYIARALQDVNGHAVPAIRMTRGSDRLFTNTAPFGFRRRSLFDYATHGIIELGSNDITSSEPLADMKNMVAEISSSMRARHLTVIGATLCPRTTSSNRWRDAPGQTPVAGFEVGGIREQYNSWIKAGASGLIDYFYDVNTVVEDPGHPGVWNTNGTANYPTTDGIHPTTYFHTLMANVVATLMRRMRVAT